MEERLLELANIFAVELYAYAVMSNHTHVVVGVDPVAAEEWSVDEVANRWIRLFPVRSAGRVDEGACRHRTAMIAADPHQVAIYRERLSSLSWFMRCLNEPIARMANREDECTGRFWEGRYKCQALLDETALLACMCYVDLNPVRAGATADLSSSEHTSVRRRLRSNFDAAQLLRPIAGCDRGALSISDGNYLALVDWSGRRLHPGKRGRIAATAPPCLGKVRAVENNWLAQVASIETCYWRAVGCVDALVEKAREIGQQWLKGSGRRRALIRWVMA